jgi:hypothetical protein
VAKVRSGGFAEADQLLYAAKIRWFDLRNYFQACFAELDTPRIPYTAVHFMLGSALGREDRFMNLFNPNAMRFLRQAYVQVEKQFFV